MGQRERGREGGREEGGREQGEKNFPLKLERRFHCERGGVTAWTEPQRLCNAAPQRTSIQLFHQQLLPPLDTTMYSPYCLTQVWDRGKRRWGAPLLKFFRCRAPPPCVCASVLSALRGVSRSCLSFTAH